MGAQSLTSIDRDQLIMSLIQVAIVNSWALNMLAGTGLETTNTYAFRIHDTVLRLIGFEKDQVSRELLDRYFALLAQTHKLDLVEMNRKLELLANNIYMELVENLKIV